MKINKIGLIILVLIFITGCAYSARPPVRIDNYQEQQVENQAVDDSSIEGTPEIANAEVTSGPQDSGGAPEIANVEVTSGEEYSPLLIDDFSEGFLDIWEYQFNAPTVENAEGYPAPSLKLPARGKIQVSSSGLGKSSEVLITTAVEPFTITNGLSVSFDVKLPETPSESPENFLGGLTVELRKQSESYPNARLGITDTRLSYLTRMSQSSTSDNRYRSASGPAIHDNKWHTFELIIDADGAAKWREWKNGKAVTKLTGYIEPGDYVVEIRASPATVFETQPYYYLVDNVWVYSLGQTPQAPLEKTQQGDSQGTVTKNPCTVYGNYYWSNGVCCPASTPYYCSATDTCYASTSLAMSESNGQCVNFRVVR